MCSHGRETGTGCQAVSNTGTYATPVWNEVKNVRDVTLNLETGESDVSTRGNGGWRANIAMLKSASLEFEMMWDTVDDDFVAIREAFLANGSMEFAVLDGPSTLSGSQGLRSTTAIMNFTRTEPLEEAIKVSVTAKPTYATDAPSWMTVT